MNIENTLQAQLALLSNALKLPRVKREAVEYSKTAAKQNLTHLQFIVQMLDMEWEEKRQRRTALRLQAAHFPNQKTFESFDFNRAPHLPEALLRHLETSEYVKNAEPIILIGEPGTGKTHLAIALGIAAAEQGFKVRFITVAELANQLMEAKDARVLSKAVEQFVKPDILILDELGYLPLKRADAELLFQVLSKRQENKPTIVTTNLPFSEWTDIFPNPRLCKAVIDRLTHRAHIVETGEQSVRFLETVKRKEEGQVGSMSSEEKEVDMVG